MDTPKVGVHTSLTKIEVVEDAQVDGEAERGSMSGPSSLKNNTAPNAANGRFAAEGIELSRHHSALGHVSSFSQMTTNSSLLPPLAPLRPARGSSVSVSEWPRTSMGETGAIGRAASIRGGSNAGPMTSPAETVARQRSRAGSLASDGHSLRSGAGSRRPSRTYGSTPIKSINLMDNIIGSSNKTTPMTGFPARPGSARFMRGGKEVEEKEGGVGAGTAVADDVPGDTPTVEAHVAHRTAKRKKAGRASDRALEQTLAALLNWHVMLAITLAIGGIILYAQFPEISFWENAAYRWIFMFAAMSAVVMPLRLWEWAFWWLVDRVLLPALPLLQEAIEFAHCAQGHLADIATVIMALLLYSVAFQLSFGSTGEWYFTRACVSLFVVKVGVVLKNAALRVAIYRLYQDKHSKGVADVVFYEEVSRTLSAPLPLALSKGAGDDDVIRRTLTPTTLLDLEGFWAQASYVRANSFTIYDDLGDCMMVDSEASMVEYAGAAFDRIASAVIARQDKAAVLEAEMRQRLGSIADDLSIEEEVAQHSVFPHSSYLGSMRGVNHSNAHNFPAPALLVVGRLLIDGLAAQQAASKQAESEAVAAGVYDDPGDIEIPVGSSSVAGPDTASLPAASQRKLVQSHEETAAAITQLSAQAPQPPTSAPAVRPGREVGAVRMPLPGAPPSSFAPEGHTGQPHSARTLGQSGQLDIPINAEATASAGRLKALGIAKDDLSPCFADRSDLDATFKLMDMDGNGTISRDEWITTFTLFLAGWTSTRAALESYSGISNALKMIAEAIYWTACCFVELAIFDVDFSRVLVPLGTVVISLSFALGPSITTLITSLLFILVTVPYDVGDRVQVNCVSNGATCLVSQINVLTTEFTTLSDNKRHMVRNTDLASQTITNHRRSPNALFCVKCIVDQQITGAQIAELRDGAEAYVRAHQVAWQPSCSVSVSAADRPGAVEISFYCTQHASWQEGGKIWPAYSQLNVAIVELLMSKGLKYRAPVQPVELFGGMAGVGGKALRVSCEQRPGKGGGAEPVDAVSASGMSESEEEEEGGPEAEGTPLLSAEGGLRRRFGAGGAGKRILPGFPGKGSSPASSSLLPTAPPLPYGGYGMGALLPTVVETASSTDAGIAEAEEGEADVEAGMTSERQAFPMPIRAVSSHSTGSAFQADVRAVPGSGLRQAADGGPALPVSGSSLAAGTTRGHTLRSAAPRITTAQLEKAEGDA